ncbi:MAG TPA: ABC transporter substrate-binding protein [Opitutaceae bacterium]
MKKTVVYPLLGYLTAAFGFTAILYLCARGLRPDVSTRPSPPDAAEVARVTELRRAALARENPPRVQRDVDYAKGARAAWWPREEAPVLAKLVEEGRLPPVAERVGPEPIVLAGLDGVGNYGGTWHRLAASFADVGTISWRLSYTSLVRWSPQGEPIVPHLARSWEVSSDFREYTFHLRRGMRWSDGAPVTADDIVYWYEHEVRYFEAIPRVIRAGNGQARVEKVDDHAVKFVFDTPNSLFLERLASNGTASAPNFDEYVVPSHYLRRFHPALGDQALIARYLRELKLASPRALYLRVKDWHNPEQPRLWPWIFRTYTPTPPFVFVRNPYYPAVDPQGRQLPYLDRVVMDVRPSNLFGLTVAAGQVSMQDRFIRHEDHVLLMSEAKRHDYQVYHWYQATRSQFTLFPVVNRRVDPDRPETRWKHELLNDRRFRQALSLAINRQDIIRALFNDQGEPAQIDPGPDTPYYSEKLFKSYTQFDPVRAGALLDGLGLTPRDREGFRTFPDGSRMTWYINMTEYTGNDPAQFVVDDWARVGVRAIPRVRARQLFFAEKAGLEHDFTVWTSESEFMPLLEPRNFVPTYQQSLYAPGFGVWYQSGGLYGHPDARRPGRIEPPVGHPLRRNMELFEQINRTPDPAGRIALFRQIQESNAEEVWTISIGTSPPQLVVVKDGFRNVAPNALYGAAYQSPGNAGLETFCWDRPGDPPATLAETKAAIAAPTLEPAILRAKGEASAGAASMPGPCPHWFIGGLVWTAVGLGGVLVAVRHPFVAQRLLLMVPTLGVISIVVFMIVQAPRGDFVHTKMLEYELQGTAASDQAIEDLRRSFHLDESPLRRYLRWVGLWWFTSFNREDAGLLQGNLGLSMEHERPVRQVVEDRIFLTILVSVATIAFTWLVALPAGIYAAVRQYSWGDYALALLGFVGMSVPGFLLAVVLMYAANRWLGFSVAGLLSPEFATTPGWNWAKFIDLLKHLWVPVLVLGLGGTAGMIRVMRANLLDELRKPYVTTARAKGVRPLKLLFKYPVRLALNPFVSGLGGLFPQLVSGGAIVALVLSLPMVGPALLDALLVEDVGLAGSLLMVLSLLGVVGTLASDLLLLWLDPRIRFGGR